MIVKSGQEAFSIWSPVLAQFAAIELLKQPHILSSSTRKELDAAVRSMSDENPPAIFRYLRISVNLHSLHLLSNIHEMNRQREMTMQFLISRQAHFPLLRKLFPDVTGQEILRIRNSIKASRPPRAKVDFTSTELNMLWQQWQTIQAEFPREIDQWMLLAEKQPHYALSTLYRALVIDAGVGK